MIVRSRQIAGLAALAGLLWFSSVLGASDQAGNSSQATTLTFGGVNYVHRWSKNGQNEFTLPSESDLARWNDMITINVHESVRNGEQLADLANRVLANYQNHGKIVRTDSKPRTSQHEAEHFIVALLGNPAFLETAFARVALVDGIGVVAVYSHRVYGKEAGEPTGRWLETNGPKVEKTLMSWDKIPSAASLKQLPQSK